MREIYRVDSRRTGELVFAGAWPDAEQCWSNQVELLEKGRHPAKTLQNHFDKYGLTDLEMSVVKKVNSEDELNQVFGKMSLKKVIIPNPAQTEKPTIPEVHFASIPESVTESVKAKKPYSRKKKK